MGALIAIGIVIIGLLICPCIIISLCRKKKGGIPIHDKISVIPFSDENPDSHEDSPRDKGIN